MMKFTLSWLKEHLDTGASLREITDTLTAIGLEVEGIENPAAALEGFRVAQITEAAQHPDADKLRVCRVETGNGELQIVCGAPNARAGLKVALAPVGTIIPHGGFTIRQSKIRGVESYGMLCSAQELKLGEDARGIIELPEDAPIGAKLAQVLELDDPVIEIAITPNRGDCLGVHGIARDLAAAGIGVLRQPDIDMQDTQQGQQGQQRQEAGLSIRIQTPQCGQFIGVLVKDVQNGPSPEWLQRRLKAIGLRPISALVDITSYMTFTYGRPLHVYDADRLSGGIIVREGQAGERFEALNDQSYTLEGGECVIADEAGMLGLGGIIGGAPSGVSENTRNVLLECAWFDPIAIAKTGRALGIDSDARYRFERHVDPGFMRTGAALATRMIVQLCGGKAAAPVIAGELPDSREPIAFDPVAINQFAGMPIAEDAQCDILSRLGFVIGEAAQGATPYRVTPPGWRPDITQPADIAEEVLRIYGYDNIPAVSLPKPAAVSPEPRNAAQRREQRLRHLLAARGLHETYHWAFMAEDKAALFGGAPDALRLRNPISADLGVMRPCLLAHLIDAASRNLARGLPGVALFELGPVYRDAQTQRSVAATLCAGERTAKQWHRDAASYGWLDAKTDALAMLRSCGIDTHKLQVTREAPTYYHPGRSGALKLGPKNVLAFFGQLHPFTLQAMDAPATTMVACELFVDAVPLPKARAPQPLQCSDFPAVERDFAFVAEASLPADTLLRAIRGADKTLITQVRLFDRYSGKGLAEDEQSLAFAVRLQAADRTLKEDEIEAASARIIAAAEKAGARLRM